jgi:hypothetical protein
VSVVVVVVVVVVAQNNKNIFVQESWQFLVSCSLYIP